MKFVNFYIEPPLSNLVRQLLYSVIEFSMMNHLRGRLPIVWNIHRLNDFSKSHRTSKYRNSIDLIFMLQPLKRYPEFRAKCIFSFLCTSPCLRVCHMVESPIGRVVGVIGLVVVTSAD